MLLLLLLPSETTREEGRTSQAGKTRCVKMANENGTEEEQVAKKIQDVKRYVNEGYCDALAMDDFATAYWRHRSSVKWANGESKKTLARMKEEMKRNIAEMKAQLRRAKNDARTYKVMPRDQFKTQHEKEFNVNYNAAKALGIGFRVGKTYLLPKKTAATTPPSSECLHIVCERLDNDGLICQTCGRVLRDSTGAAEALQEASA